MLTHWWAAIVLFNKLPVTPYRKLSGSVPLCLATTVRLEASCVLRGNLTNTYWPASRPKNSGGFLNHSRLLRVQPMKHFRLKDCSPAFWWHLKNSYNNNNNKSILKLNNSQKTTQKFTLRRKLGLSASLRWLTRYDPDDRQRKNADADFTVPCLQNST